MTGGGIRVSGEAAFSGRPHGKARQTQSLLTRNPRDANDGRVFTRAVYRLGSPCELIPCQPIFCHAGDDGSDFPPVYAL